MQCGYDRGGLKRHAPCPECGHIPGRPAAQPFLGRAWSIEMALLIAALGPATVALAYLLRGARSFAILIGVVTGAVDLLATYLAWSATVAGSGI